MTEPDPSLLARIEVYETPLGAHGVRVYTRQGMTGEEMADVLRQLAQGFQNGTIARVDQ